MLLVMNRFSLIVLAPLLFTACGPTETEPESETSYHRDVRPIFERSCMGCHTEGAIGPFTLTSFDDASNYAPLIKTAVQNRTMPPWLADPGCNNYVADPSLTDDEIGLIAAWVDEGAPEGDPADYVAPLDLTDDNADEQALNLDVELSLPVAYVPTLEANDDYRCFVLDWNEPDTKFITGFWTFPDNAEIVHHVIAYYVPPNHVAEVQALDDSDPEPGYSCYGGSGVNDAEWLGAWAPGAVSGPFPAGTGLQVRPNSKIVIQMHYNVVAGTGADQTRVAFTLADQVEKPGFFALLTNPLWVTDGAMQIPAGEKGVVHTFELGLDDVTDQPFTVYDASLHMHQLGENGSMWVDRATGERDCILTVSDWDFNWQLSYRLQEPLVLQPEDTVAIECQWDNSAENQPIINGEAAAPRDVAWGDGSYDEMCLGILFITGAE